MARNLFGGTADSVAEDVTGARVPNAVGTVWDGPSAGATQLTDLTDSNGTPITQLTANSNGFVAAFFGPDGYERLWVDFGAGKVGLVSVTVGERLDALVAQKGAANGLATLDSSGHVPISQIPAGSSGASPSDWLNVKDFGAVGDGSTDDTAVIQLAINSAGIGGVVYFPKGIYKISASLDLPRGVTLIGSHSNLMVGPGMGDEDFPCYIQAAPSMTTGSMIKIIGDADGTHPAINGEQRIMNLMLDGSKLTTGSVDGIYAKGNVQNVVMRDVCIRKMTNNGIITASNAGDEWPYSWRLHSVMVDNCHAGGYVFNRHTDLTLEFCQAIGCFAHGFQLSNSANTQIVGCRAEWSGNYGFYLTGNWGNWAGSGGGLMASCTTDRCGWDGIRIDTTGNGPIQLSGIHTRRDGRNGGTGAGGYAGIRIAAAGSPVLMSNITCYPGVDDAEGTSVNSPQYGVSVTGASASVQLDSAYLHAATEGLHDDGTNGKVLVGPAVVTATGTTAAPTVAATSPWNWLGTASAKHTTAAGIAYKSGVAGEANPRMTIEASGLIRFGPGGATAPDTPAFYRSNAGAVAIDSFLVMTGGGQSNGDFWTYTNNKKAINAGSPGGGFSIAEGANARMGTATLAAGTVTVNNTSVTADTRIFLTNQTLGGTPGFLRVSARTAGTSFTILSSSGTDTSTIAWVMFEPA